MKSKRRGTAAREVVGERESERMKRDVGLVEERRSLKLKTYTFAL